MRWLAVVHSTRRRYMLSHSNAQNAPHDVAASKKHNNYEDKDVRRSSTRDAYVRFHLRIVI